MNHLIGGPINWSGDSEGNRDHTLVISLPAPTNKRRTRCGDKIYIERRMHRTEPDWIVSMECGGGFRVLLELQDADRAVTSTFLTSRPQLEARSQEPRPDSRLQTPDPPDPGVSLTQDALFSTANGRHRRDAPRATHCYHELA